MPTVTYSGQTRPLTHLDLAPFRQRTQSARGGDGQQGRQGGLVRSSSDCAGAPTFVTKRLTHQNWLNVLPKQKNPKDRPHCPNCCALTHLGAVSVAGRGTASQEAAAPGVAVDEGGPGHACSVGRPANNGGASASGRTGGGGASAGAPAAVANPVPKPRMHPQILLPQRRSFLHRCK